MAKLGLESRLPAPSSVQSPPLRFVSGGAEGTEAPSVSSLRSSPFLLALPESFDPTQPNTLTQASPSSPQPAGCPSFQPFSSCPPRGRIRWRRDLGPSPSPSRRDSPRPGRCPRLPPSLLPASRAGTTSCLEVSAKASTEQPRGPPLRGAGPRLAGPSGAPDTPLPSALGGFIKARSDVRGKDKPSIFL